VTDLEIYLDDNDVARALRDDVRTGLTATPKWLPPKWFYDAAGSALFEEITKLPEYYPTRAERAILDERAAEIARITEAKTLVELGSGSSEKTRLLLDALSGHGTLASFLPLDVSASALREAVAALREEYPGIDVHGIVGDFTKHLIAVDSRRPEIQAPGRHSMLPGGGTRLVAFLGGTIGNLLPAERAHFLATLRAALEPGEWLLLGTDLVKAEKVLVPAYDDAAGVTAEFNRNVLRVINRELDADFDVAAYDHVALWDPEHEWIEMRLRASRAMRVLVRKLDLAVDFAAGEELRTEISAKFRRDGLERELEAAGFTLRQWWTDPDGRFGVSLSQA
jgi:L-histidine Nalpha-methyltransferase